LNRSTIRLCQILAGGFLAGIGCSAVRPNPTHTTVELRGVIRDREGIGVRGVRVSLDPVDDGRSVWIGANTNHKGEYLLRVSKGVYQCRLITSENRVPPAILDTIHLSHPRERFDYQYGGLKVGGRISGPGGASVKRGSVLAIGTDATGLEILLRGEIANGHYRLFLPRSTYSLQARPRSGQYPRRWFLKVDIAADTTIDFDASGHLITGRVTLRKSTPLRGALVVAHGVIDGITTEAEGVTGNDGRFKLYLPTGDYTLGVVPQGADEYVARQSFPFEANGPHTMDLDFEGTLWSGTVRDSATNKAIPDLEISTYDLARSRTDRQGRFKLFVRRGTQHFVLINQPRAGIHLSRTLINGGGDSTLNLYVRAVGAAKR
jgi:hypothetical protein